MKKTLIALAAVAATGSVFAQATISGTIAARYQNSTTDGVDKINGFEFSDTIFNISTTEDLGGGLTLNARMSFEGGADTANTTGAGATLGLTSATLGSLTFSSVESADYLPVDLVTTSGFSNGSRNDRLTYTSPAFMGARFSVIYGDAVIGTGSNTFNSSTVYSLDYANGPLTANVGKLSVDKNSHPTLNSGTRVKVGYNFGVAAVTYGQVNTKGATDIERKEKALSVSAPIGAFTVAAHMVNSKTGTAAKLDGNALSVSYALSKRTSIAFEKVDYETATFNSAERTRLTLSHNF